MNQLPPMIRPTKGPFWVRPNISRLSGHLTITSETRPVIATIPPNEDGTPNYADASLLSASAHMIDALCEIQLLINTHSQVTTVAINQIISNAFEKIRIEAGGEPST